ncbi:hypothetical protein [Membranihabitans maritimus]|uniref:hypothetical protein n=1 Tax=Membranihabitans maritimus TaxID=2904244 RepID=UPI001F2560EE|nr:hypothetical protein [Membranihabitans maritimus]
MGRYFLLLPFISLFCTSCLETEISLDSEDYHLIDSLYTLQKDSLEPILDEQCTEFRDSIIPIWIDSIRAKREEEIQSLIQNQQ